MNALNRLFRNRSTEKDVRDYLQENGFQAASARFDDLELTAIKRPGWVQIFRFGVRVLDDRGKSHQFLGVARDDDRTTIEVFLTDSAIEQNRVIDEWSVGLIILRREKSRLNSLFLTVFGLIFFIAMVGAILSR